MPSGSWFVSRDAMVATCCCFRSGTLQGCFLSSVMTSKPLAVEMAREEWKRLIV